MIKIKPKLTFIGIANKTTGLHGYCARGDGRRVAHIYSDRKLGTGEVLGGDYEARQVFDVLAGNSRGLGAAGVTVAEGTG